MSKILCRFLLLWSLAISTGCFDESPASSGTRDTAVVLSATQTPVPSFLRDVYPEPGSRVTQAAHRTETGGLFYPISAAICVDINQQNLLEQDDNNLNSRNYVERSHLQVSVISPDLYSVPVRNDLRWTSEAGGALNDKRGNAIGGILIVCWKVDLTPGVYEATFEHKQTSGHVLSYTWSFEITE